MGQLQAGGPGSHVEGNPGADSRPETVSDMAVEVAALSVSLCDG
jgi:hypothetical protein